MNTVQSLFLIGVLGYKDSHSTSIENSLPITLYLHFTHDLNSSILWEKLFAYLLKIYTFVHMIST